MGRKPNILKCMRYPSVSYLPLPERGGGSFSSTGQLSGAAMSGAVLPEWKHNLDYNLVCHQLVKGQFRAEEGGQPGKRTWECREMLVFPVEG